MFRGTQPAEVVKHLASRGLDGIDIALTGTISSVDPKTFTAKVTLGISGIETGWLPIGSILAGNGYGIAALPEEGTEVTVLFDNGDINSGKIMLCNFNKTDKPPQGLKPGEILVQSEGGGTIKLDSSGNVTFNGGSKQVARVGDSVQISVNGSTYTGVITSGSSNVLA